MRNLIIFVAILFTTPAGAQMLRCATKMFSLPGKEFTHKIVLCDGVELVGADFHGVASLSLKTDRRDVGNRYSYVFGTAPREEGTYTYSLLLRDADGVTSTEDVTLLVSSHLQSPTPMMGWLTWNWFARDISHEKILGIAEGMQRYGLVDAGFNTIVLDDAWAANQSDKALLNYDEDKFPLGITGFVSALKAINPKIKAGIYSDAGSMTCENYQPGSFGFETAHLALFDSWGIDMLKYDFCNNEATAFESYSRMGEAVRVLNEKRKTEGRIPFVLNICEWGSNEPWRWAAEAGGSSWRSTADAREIWIGNKGLPGVLAGADINRRLWMYAGVNRYNDMDMMAIGLHGLGSPSNYTPGHERNGGVIASLSDEQARTQMSLWCMMASPLSLTCDLRLAPHAEANKTAGSLPEPLITQADIATLTNTDIISINQDALGQQAEYMEHLSTGCADFSDAGYDIYVKDLTNCRKAVAICNRSVSNEECAAISLHDVYLCDTISYQCRDVWSGEETIIHETLHSGIIHPCETKVFILTALPH